MRITFVSHGDSGTTLSTVSASGQTVLEAAHLVGVEVVATCGARGRCRSCRIKVLKGNLPPASDEDYAQLGKDEVREGFRLACQTKVTADCSVLIAPPASEVGYQVYVNEPAATPESRASVDSGVEQHCVTTRSTGAIEEQQSEAERLLAKVPASVAGDLRLEVLRKLAGAVHRGQGQVTLTAFNGSFIDIAPGDMRAGRYGMAFDIGTTTIVGSLLDLASGDRLASVANANPQATYGGDLMSRIAFAQASERNAAALRARVLQTLNDSVTEACRKAQVLPEQVYKIVVVGNPCMHHILLGIDVAQLGIAPYAPVVRDALLVSGRELPLKSAPQACICLLPLIAGFVGADTVGALLATDLDTTAGTRLLVDIGTNTEVVMATGGQLVACSAPAGPAFEGGQIRYGMRAALGAIEEVQISSDVTCKVIGDTEPLGICGSGLIDAVAQMLDAGLISPGGGLGQGNRDDLPTDLRKRLRDGAEGAEFVLVSAERSGRAEDITLTQGDIRQLQLAKGAIYSAIHMLQHVMGVANEQVDELLLCGGFGNYINLDSAVRIRMLPALAEGRVRYIGNGAHTGAEIALLSESARMRAGDLARRVTHISLTEQPQFQDVFVEALGI